MGVHVLAVYRPKPGKQAELEAEMVRHVPLLRKLGLATDAPARVLRAPDGTIVESFEWESHDAIRQAHDHPEVLEMWGRYDTCSTYGSLRDLPNADIMFPEFELLGTF